MENNFWTIDEVSKFLRLTHKGVWFRYRAGKLEAIRDGGRLLFPARQFQTLIDFCKSQPQNQTGATV